MSKKRIITWNAAPARLPLAALLISAAAALGACTTTQEETTASTQGAQNMDEAKSKMLDDIKQAVAILSAKGSPQEIATYKKLMVDVAEKVANAAKEGGFMGVGGTLVNDAEKTAISDIQKAVA